MIGTNVVRAAAGMVPQSVSLTTSTSTFIGVIELVLRSLSLSECQCAHDTARRGAYTLAKSSTV